MSDLKSRISEATKTAMKAREKARVAALRLVNADIQRVEVDERRTLSDEDIVSILGRMVKQRRDSLVHFETAAREDLAAQERFEISVIEEFLPEPLCEAEVDALIERIVAESGASTMKDMGRVMGVLKGEVAGRADMGLLSGKVKARLS
jgi:hypothetical protein